MGGDGEQKQIHTCCAAVRVCGIDGSRLLEGVYLFCAIVIREPLDARQAGRKINGRGRGGGREREREEKSMRTAQERRL